MWRKIAQSANERQNFRSHVGQFFGAIISSNGWLLICVFRRNKPGVRMAYPAVGTGLRTLPGACVGWLLCRRRRWFVHCRWSRWRAVLDFFFLRFFLLSTTCISIAHDLLPLD